MTFEEFLKKQSEIYAEIEASGDAITSTGIMPKIVPTELLVVCLKFPGRFTSKLSQISQGVAGIIPAISYTPNDFHTTITTLPANTPVDLVVSSVETVANKFRPTISFEKLIWNNDSVILKGIPNEDFVFLGVQLVQTLKTLGLDAVGPKMAHITINRFRKNVKDEKKLLELRNYLQSQDVRFNYHSAKITISRFVLTEANANLQTLFTFDVTTPD